jgi:uncharacterized membrane protein YedE/YeeE
MHFPLAFITADALLWAGLFFGFLFGILLHRGGVTDFNVIVRFFLWRDFTVLKVMLTAIVVGGIGVFALHEWGLVQYHIKPAALLAVILGAAIFGVGMVIFGYCPGTGLAAIATGKIDALMGFVGMLVGGVLYAFTYDWVAAHLLPVANFGAKRLPDLLPVPEWLWYAGLVIVASMVFRVVQYWENRPDEG